MANGCSATPQPLQPLGWPRGQGQDTMTSWLKSGKISDCSTFVDGFENLPEGILGLFKGSNIGKMLVRVPLESTAGYGKWWIISVERRTWQRNLPKSEEMHQ